MQNISSTAPSAQTIETITIPHELAVRLNNAAYFYGDALNHIVRTFLPSIALASQCGDSKHRLILASLKKTSCCRVVIPKHWQKQKSTAKNPNP